jgi:hypothetical protein
MLGMRNKGKIHRAHCANIACRAPMLISSLVASSYPTHEIFEFQSTTLKKYFDSEKSVFIYLLPKLPRKSDDWRIAAFLFETRRFSLFCNKTFGPSHGRSCLSKQKPVELQKKN